MTDEELAGRILFERQRAHEKLHRLKGKLEQLFSDAKVIGIMLSGNREHKVNDDGVFTFQDGKEVAWPDPKVLAELYSKIPEAEEILQSKEKSLSDMGVILPGAYR